MSGYIPDACCGLTAPNPFEIRSSCFRFLSRLRRLLYCFCRQGQKLLRIVDRHMTLYSHPLPMDAQKPAFCKGYERLIVHTAATASKGKASAPGIWNAPACPPKKATPPAWPSSSPFRCSAPASTGTGAGFPRRRPSPTSPGGWRGRWQGPGCCPGPTPPGSRPPSPSSCCGPPSGC